MSAAHWAFIFRPPSRMNNVTTGSTAKIALRPSESETGLKSCVYTESPPSLGAVGGCPARSIGETPSHGARRLVRHLPRRHAVPVGRAGGRAAAGAPRRAGGVSRGADVLRADAPEQRLRRRGAGAGAPPRRRVRGLRGGGHAVRIVRRDGA